ncbi:MAG: hypothetical protein R3D67_22040 [Hyphomicrobiaceae bacterium]
MTNVDVASKEGQNDVIVPSEGYDASRLNAVRHGILSRYTVLPWEDGFEYDELLEVLTAEHAPAGPTETHLVVELAGVLWRKRRLRHAEIASFQRGLHRAADSYTDSKTVRSALVLARFPDGAKINVADAVRAGGAEPKSELVSLEADRQMTLSAIELLKGNRNDAYEAALQALHPSTLDAWLKQLDWKPGDYEAGDTPFKTDSESLLRYLETEILSWYERERAVLTAQPLVRSQALGESLDPDKLERLGRYEVHLDRKFERTLSTLLRLQELRRARAHAPADGAAS